MCIMCLAGPAGEEFICGRVNDGSAEADYGMAREYLARQCDPLRAAAVDRPVRTPFVEDRIRQLIAAALLRHGTSTARKYAG